MKIITTGILQLLHLGPFLFSILINSLGTKSRRALVGVPDDITEAQSAHAEASFYAGILLLDDLVQENNENR